MKKILLIAVLMLVAGSASAYDFMSSGLCYKITGTNPNTVMVTCQNQYDASSTKARYDRLDGWGRLEIPQYVSNNGKTYTVTAIDDYAFAYTKGDPTLITIAPSVETIGAYAFRNFGSENYELSFVNPANSRLTTIKEHAFHDNGTRSKLTGSLYLPASLRTIERYAFFTSGLTSVSLPGQLTTIGDNAFYNNLFTTLDVPGSVTSIGNYAFALSQLASVTLNEGITTIGFGMFNSCRKLTSIYLPSTLTTIGQRAFEDANTLPSIEIPISVTEIGTLAFRGDSALTTITIPSGVTTIGKSVFLECKALKSAVVKNPVLGERQFYGCISLDNISLSNSITEIPLLCFSGTAFKKFTIPASITTIGDNAFQNTQINTLTVDADLVTVGANVFTGSPVTTLNVNSNTFKASLFPELKNMVTSASFGNNVTAIAESALQNYAVLKTLTLPAGLASIGNSAFSGCTQLMEVTAFMPRPFSIDASVFEGVQQHGYCDLHVIDGAGPRYRAMEVWKEFTMIFEDAVASPTQGDLDGNGVLEVNDVVILAELAMSGGATAEQISIGDLDGSGTIDVNDVVMLAGMVMGS